MRLIIPSQSDVPCPTIAAPMRRTPPALVPPMRLSHPQRADATPQAASTRTRCDSPNPTDATSPTESHRCDEPSATSHVGPSQCDLPSRHAPMRLFQPYRSNATASPTPMRLAMPGHPDTDATIRSWSSPPEVTLPTEFEPNRCDFPSHSHRTDATCRTFPRQSDKPLQPPSRPPEATNLSEPMLHASPHRPQSSRQPVPQRLRAKATTPSVSTRSDVPRHTRSSQSDTPVRF
jgi:hypothetical protein